MSAPDWRAATRASRTDLPAAGAWHATAVTTLLVLLCASHAAAQVTIGWNPSSEPDVAGYKLYVGAASRTYHDSIDVGTRTSYTVTGLQDDRPYYFAVTAYTSNGAESGFSAEVTTALSVRLFPEDTWINIDAVNYSTHRALKTYTWPDRNPANAAVLKFDFSGIPSTALVQKGTLQLSLTESDSAPEGTYSVAAHKIVGQEPVIARATGYTADGATPWAPSNCCYRGIPLAQANVAPPESATFVDKTAGAKTWTISSMVQDWVADPAANAGVLLNADAAARADRYRYFASMEHPDPRLRPVLHVEYFVPRRTDATRPAVWIISPAHEAPYVSGTIGLAAEAKDESGIAGVRFFVDGTQVGSELTAAPYATVWDTTAMSDGAHALVAVARDAAGNTAASAPVAITVANGVARLAASDTSLNLDARNYSAHARLMTYTWPDRRAANAAVLKFDLTTLPAGAVVHEATLRLALVDSDAAPGSTYFVSAHKIVGRNPAIDRATGYTADGVTGWTATACCHNNVPLAQGDLSPAYDTRGIDQTRGEKTWNLTHMVQEWLAAPGANFGVLLNSDTSVPADRYRYFASAEHPTADLRPVLHIVYSAPK